MANAGRDSEMGRGQQGTAAGVRSMRRVSPDPLHWAFKRSTGPRNAKKGKIGKNRNGKKDTGFAKKALPSFL